MTNNRFDDIDKLFREGLNPEMDQFASVEADWSKLRARLDRHDKKKRGIFWLSRLGGVAALILLFFAIRTLLPDNQNKIVLKNEVQQIGRNIKEYQNSKIALKKDLNLVSKTDQNISSLLAQNKQSGKQSSINQLDELSSVKKSQDRDTIMERNSDLQNASGVHSTQTQKPNTSQTELEKTYDPKQPKDQESLFAADEKPNLQSVSSHESRKLALSFLAASDFNGVNNLNNAIIGNDLGVIVSYKIAKKWSFSSGAVYGKKLYETGFSNYNPIKDIWTEYYPKSVSADCRVLDIPLNISYSFFNRKNTSISMGTGISSYIMLREDYSFSYVEQDDDTALAYHVVNENQHWFKVINFQATFEQRLNPNFSVGIQPFMKIPLSNIGFAGVKLQSLGMAVILSYNLNH